MMNTPQEQNAVRMRLVPPGKVANAVNVLPAAATVNGTLEASSDLCIRIDGNYTGKIDMKVGGTVHISVGAVVVTDMLVADFVYVEGTVKGDLHARQAVELAATSLVHGSVRYDKHLDIHPGARLTGQMNGPDAEQ